MHKARLAKLGHARMNMHLVPCDHLTGMDLSEELDMESMFTSVFDVVAEIDEQEEVAGVAKTREMLQSEVDLEGVEVLTEDLWMTRSGVLMIIRSLR
jgi:hypothetical protein